MRRLAGHAAVIGEVGLRLLNRARARVNQDDVEWLQRVVDPRQGALHVLDGDSCALVEVPEVEDDAVAVAVVERNALGAGASSLRCRSESI